MAILARLLTHHPQVGWRAAPHDHAHPHATHRARCRPRHAGRQPSAAGLAARMRACLDADAAWYGPLAERCARMPGEHWRRLTPRTLASLIERDVGYQHAWLAEHKPKVRRYILRERVGMNPLPLGLDRCQVPYWPHTAALGRWLGVSDAGMWRLTRASGMATPRAPRRSALPLPPARQAQRRLATARSAAPVPDAPAAATARRPARPHPAA